MVFDNVGYLITETLQTNAVGDTVATESRRMVYIATKSISFKRKIEAEQLGLKAEKKFILADKNEYDGEAIIEVDEVKYNITAVWENEGRTVELTCGRF